MFEKTSLLFIYCITPAHLGSGQALGVIDNPIARERHTEHPMMPGSGLKGAFREHLEGLWGNDGMVTRLFGPESSGSDYAGAISFGDAQIIAFPVRSLKSAFVYAVSPLTLARLKRLATITGIPVDWSAPEVPSGQCLVRNDQLLQNDKLVLEAFEFIHKKDEAMGKIADWLLEKALPKEEALDFFREKIKKDTVLLPDDAFSYFVRNATVVEPHVRIDNDTGTAAEGGLFYTENLPPEAILVAPVFASRERTKNGSDKLEAQAVMQSVVNGDNGKKGLQNALVQIGGDATTGRGQVILNFIVKKEATT